MSLAIEQIVETRPEAEYSQRLACVLLLDTSYSMEGPRLAGLQAGLAGLIDELKNDDKARVTVDLAIMTFDSEVRRVQDFALPDASVAPKLQVNGLTCIGQAALDALELIEERRDFYKQNGNPYYRPILFILTDGVPQGDKPGVLEAAQKALAKAQQAKRVRVWPVCVGSGEIPTALQDLTGTDVLELKETRWLELFQWLSGSFISVSYSGSDATPPALPSPSSWMAE